MRFAFIEAEKATYPVTVLCRVLRVSTSGFYAWLCRDPSEHTQGDEALIGEIVAAFHRGRGTYGSPRVHAELIARGIPVGRKRVARLMAEHGLYAAPKRRFRRTTDSSHSLPVAENVLDRHFDPGRANAVWASDLTYLWTAEGWLYLAVVLDLFSRRVVGWSTSKRLLPDLVTNALEMAVGRRLPPAQLLHHSDRGSQYASDAFQTLLARHGILCSMSRRGDCWDNAVVESFFGTLKTELIYQQPWMRRSELHVAIAEYIELFYNTERRHSYLGYLSPAGYEKEADKTTPQAA